MSVRGGVVEGPLVFGALSIAPSAVPSRGREIERYNSVVAMGADGAFVGISDKVELLAFGEYTPLWDYLPPLQERFPRGLTPGTAPKVLTVDGIRVGVLNCYEDVLAHHARWVARHEPDFLLNATNDAWFGETTEPFLHQMVARMRAVETRRDLVRAVNTGVSSHTLATGEDVIRTPIMVERTFIAEVRTMRGETLWTRFGDWVTPLLAALLLAAVLRRRREA
jgi:apolipoprotein N-acyltransferase